MSKTEREELQKFVQTLVATNTRLHRENQARNAVLKAEYDPARELTSDQIVMLIGWGETLQHYRQLPILEQHRLHGSLVLHENRLASSMGREMKTEGVHNWVQRNQATAGGSLAEGKKLLMGSVATDYFFTVMPNRLPNARFGYQFILKHQEVYYNLFCFIRHGEPLTQAAIAGIIDTNLYPTSVLDFPGNKSELSPAGFVAALNLN